MSAETKTLEIRKIWKIIMDFYQELNLRFPKKFNLLFPKIEELSLPCGSWAMHMSNASRLETIKIRHV